MARTAERMEQNGNRASGFKTDRRDARLLRAGYRLLADVAGRSVEPPQAPRHSVSLPRFRGVVPPVLPTHTFPTNPPDQMRSLAASRTHSYHPVPRQG